MVADEMQTVDLGHIVRVLRQADAGWPDGFWATDAFAWAVWNGLLGGAPGEDVTLTDKGRAFLHKFGPLYREET